MTDFLESLRDRARAEWSRLGLEESRVPLDASLPSVPRVFAKRGDPSCTWILGRVVRTAGRDDTSFEDFLANDHELADVRSAVEQLARLPCMCGTGAETVEQHGTIQVLAGGQNPDAPVDDVTQIGFCTRCHRGWEFNACGDSHYSYTYDVRPFVLTGSNPP